MIKDRLTYGFEGAHSEQVGHHCGEAWSKTGLCDESQFKLSKANHIISAFPVPAGNVQQVRLFQVNRRMSRVWLSIRNRRYTSHSDYQPCIFFFILSEMRVDNSDLIPSLISPKNGSSYWPSLFVLCKLM